MKAMLFGLATLVFATAFAEGYITSVQLPGGATKKFRDSAAWDEISTNIYIKAGVDEKTRVNDVNLYGQWNYSPRRYNGGYYKLDETVNPPQLNIFFPDSPYPQETGGILDTEVSSDTNLVFNSVGFSETGTVIVSRTRELVGYTIGHQDGKVLMPTNDIEAKISGVV